MTASSIYRLEVELTNTCNLKCALCSRETIYTKEDFNVKKSMDFDALTGYLHTLENLKYVTLAGEYSEPTLYPELFELIVYLHKRKIEVSLFLNGETHNDSFYRKLSLMFKQTKSVMYFTIFGSTQEMHERYRVGSKLETVLRRAEMVNKIAPNNIVLTWVVFEYNKLDYEQNSELLNGFNYHVFNSLPFAERYSLEKQIHEGICMPDGLDKIYGALDKSDLKGECKSIRNNFGYLDVDLGLWPCSIAKRHKYDFNTIECGLKPECYECSVSNIKKLSDHNIYTVAESEDETSEHDLYIDSRD